MQIAVGDGVEGAMRVEVGGCSWRETDFSFQDWLGEDLGSVGAKLRPCQFNRQQGTLGDIVERNPGDVMLDLVGVGDLLADRNFDF